MDLDTAIKALQAIGPVLSAVPAVQTVFRSAMALLGSADAQELDALLVSLAADNDAGHARLQTKLAELAKR